MMAGGRPPPLMTLVRAWAASADLPASSCWGAASTTRCASSGACRFFLVSPPRPSPAPYAPLAWAFFGAGLGGGRLRLEGGCAGRDDHRGHSRQSQPAPVARHVAFIPPVDVASTRSPSRS